MSEMIDPTEMGLDDSQEPYAVKAGEEYKLIIIEVREGTDKNDLSYIMPRVEVVGQPYAKDFTHFLHLPDAENMGDKQLNRVRWALKTFFEAFGVDTSQPLSLKDDLVGLEGYAILGLGTDDQYGEQNFIKTLVTPK